MRAHMIAEGQNAARWWPIDGPCGGGKTTLAFKLHKAFPDSVIIHADDFFLRPHQRTEERLKEPGGNMDRERLQEEVLQKVPLGEPFTYSSYDCQQDVMVPVRYEPRSLVIVEGSYSHHPDLKPSYDLLVFVDVDADTQLDRLKMRGAEARCCPISSTNGSRLNTGILTVSYQSEQRFVLT